MKTAYGMAIRSGLIATIAALSLGTSALWASVAAAEPVSSQSILEQPTVLRAELDWNMSSDSLQSRLFEALSLLRPDSNVGVVQGKDGSVSIVDKANRIRCQAATIGSQGLDEVPVVGAPHAQVMNYRCDITLISSYLGWTSWEQSAQAHLFRALASLDELRNRKNDDRVSTLEKNASKDSVLLRLVDDSTASKIACEKRLVRDGDVSAQSVPVVGAETPEYRCIFDLKP